MKRKRQKLILDIISNKAINTQDDILDALKEMKVDATQATVSRDIKELGIVKTVTGYGKYQYVQREPIVITDNNDNAVKFKSIFKDSVTNISYAQNILVVKCHQGMANAACAALESLDIIKAVGMLAGDDTIFILLADINEAKRYEIALNNFLTER